MAKTKTPRPAEPAAAATPPSPAALPPLAIQSRAQADLALREIGEINALEASLKKRCDAAINAVVTHWAPKMVVRVGDADMPFKERREALEQDLKAFVLATHQELFGEGKKSIELNHGTLGMCPSQPAVLTLEGVTENQALERISGAFMTRIRKLLQSARLGFGKANAFVLRLKAELDKRGILTKYKEGAITDAQLAKVGLRVRASEDAFYYEANEAQVEKQSDEPLPSKAA